MNCLVVTAHPLENSLCHFLTRKTVDHLTQKGYQVTLKNLYKENFDPVLSSSERAKYYTINDPSLANDEIDLLLSTESLVLIFPTWWFSFPAILKGWFDRVWAPGFAYHHDENLGLLKPNLKKLKEVKVVTTLGSAWWIDRLVMQRPVRKVLKRALIGACAIKSKFQMISFYKCESVSPARLERFVRKIESRF